jgi:hypothetical protein
MLLLGLQRHGASQGCVCMRFVVHSSRRGCKLTPSNHGSLRPSPMPRAHPGVSAGAAAAPMQAAVAGGKSAEPAVHLQQALSLVAASQMHLAARNIRTQRQIAAVAAAQCLEV